MTAAEQARQHLRTDMLSAMRGVLGRGYVDHYYEDNASPFVDIAEQYAADRAELAVTAAVRAERERHADELKAFRDAAATKQARRAAATLSIAQAVAKERKRARLARLRQRRANRTHLYRYLGRSPDGQEMAWEGPGPDSRAELVTVSTEYFWSGGRHARADTHTAVADAPSPTNPAAPTQPAKGNAPAPQEPTSPRSGLVEDHRFVGPLNTPCGWVLDARPNHFLSIICGRPVDEHRHVMTTGLSRAELGLEGKQ